MIRACEDSPTTESITFRIWKPFFCTKLEDFSSFSILFSVNILQLSSMCFFVEWQRHFFHASIFSTWSSTVIWCGRHLFGKNKLLPMVPRLDEEYIWVERSLFITTWGRKSECSEVIVVCVSEGSGDIAIITDMFCVLCVCVFMYCTYAFIYV